MTSPPEGPRRAHVVGLGLIGGSVALGLTAAGWSVTGEDRDPATETAAIGRGAVTGRATDRPDVVVVAVPTTSVTVLAVLVGIWFIVTGLTELVGALMQRHAAGKSQASQAQPAGTW